MCTNKIKKLGSHPYTHRTDEVVEEALQKVVDRELSILKVCKIYNIPYGTLHNHLNGKYSKNQENNQYLVKRMLKI